jgi:NADPH-dependent 2,4-dienoyl-CoA reductase/sulfur reductase-like enzyme
MRYVIIGASAAGLRAAETLRRYAPRSAITLISDEEHLPYSRPLLTYLLSGEATPDKVFLRGKGYFRQWHFDAKLGAPVVKVAPEAHEVRLASGEIVPYDRLLVASGARPRLLGIPGEDLGGVYVLRTLADWQKLDAGLAGIKDVVVVGAGAVGLKAADALARRGLTVHLLARGSQPLSRVLDKVAARLLGQALERMGIRLYKHSWPVALQGRLGRLSTVILNENREIAAPAALFSVGVDPNVEFLGDSGLANSGGVLVDEYLATADPDIFAAGDCTQPHHLLTGQRSAYHIWPAAAAQGRVAGANMAGAGRRYDGLLPQNSISLLGFKIITGGLSPQETEDCRVESGLNESRGQYHSLIYRGGKLVGLTLIGDEIKHAGIYFQLMAQQTPMTGPVDPGRLWG